MGLNAKNKGGGGFDPIPEGVELAICYGIVDLGTHHHAMYNKDFHKVLFMWELPDVRFKVRTADGHEKDMPRVISRRYTLSLHEKSQLRPMLEAWRGKKFTSEELEGFDLRKVLGAACQISIVHEKSKKGDDIYANVAAIMALPKGTPKPKGELDQIWFSFEEYDGGDLPKVQDWILKTVMESAEWKKINGQEDKQDHDEVPVDRGDDGETMPF